MEINHISSFEPKWLILEGFIAAFIILILILTGMTWQSNYYQKFCLIFEKGSSSKIIRTISIPLFILILFIYPIISLYLYKFPSSVISLLNGRFLPWLLGLIILTAVLVLKLSGVKFTYELMLLSTILGESVLYKIFRFIPSVSTYPFALTWEESHRPYSASLIASEQIYGIKIPFNLSDISLNLLNGIPFLFGHASILIYRLWVAFLWIGVSALVSFLLIRRIRIESRLVAWLFSGWVFLYLLQEGGIKYNLLLCVVIILAGFSTRKPWRMFSSVILASIWAGISRVNWYPVPAMLGVALFLLEEPMKKYHSILQYLFKPALLGVIGVATAILTNSLISLSISGTSGSFGGEQLRSALLWYRLFPNATYPMGILPAVILASFPLLLVCFLVPRGRWHYIRIAGLFTLSAILFVGGLVVSVNIGGGSDLHNMDAFLIMLMIIATYVFFDSFAVDKQISRRNPLWWIVALPLIMPVWSAIRIIQPIIPYDHLSVAHALQTLKLAVENAAQKGDVLFMYERPLITFGYIHVPVVNEYEGVTIFGPARSGDEIYMNLFYHDLQTHRFSLIVTEPQPKGLQDETHQFGEENNVFFIKIAQPLLCYYELVSTIPEASIELYKPRSNSENCNISFP